RSAPLRPALEQVLLRADAYPVAHAQFGGATNALTVHVNAVAALQVFDHEADAATRHRRVLARDRLVALDAYVAIFAAADHEIVRKQRVNPYFGTLHEMHERRQCGRGLRGVLRRRRGLGDAVGAEVLSLSAHG